MRYILLYNPVSGKRKFHKKVPFIKQFFAEKNLSLDVYESKYHKDLEEVAKNVASNYDTIIVAGGDGSVNEVINGVMRTKSRPSIAILPYGTANDTASILGFNKNLKRSLKIITESTPLPMDVNRLNDHFFMYATAAGVLTKVSYSVSRNSIRRYGYLAYLISGTKDIFQRYKMDMKIEYNNEVLEDSFMLALGLSSRRVAGLFLYNYSKSKVDNGNLELRLIKAGYRFRIIKLLLFFISGGKKIGRDIHISSNNINITTSNDVIWNVDGERSDSGSVHIRVYHREIKFYASKKAKRRVFTKS